MMPGDLAAGGTPSNLGKIGNAGKVSFELSFCHRHRQQIFVALADADPLGVNTNVTFDEVGGLDDRKHTHFSILLFIKLNVHLQTYIH